MRTRYVVLVLRPISGWVVWSRHKSVELAERERVKQIENGTDPELIQIVVKEETWTK